MWLRSETRRIESEQSELWRNCEQHWGSYKKLKLLKRNCLRKFRSWQRCQGKVSNQPIVYNKMQGTLELQRLWSKKTNLVEDFKLELTNYLHRWRRWGKPFEFLEALSEYAKEKGASEAQVLKYIFPEAWGSQRKTFLTFSGPITRSKPLA